MASGALPAGAAAGGGDALGWRAHGALLGTIWIVLLLLFAADARDMVTIWWSSSTFQHCLFVPPIVGWLLWQRRRQLACLAPRGWSPGLLIVAAGAGGWLLGEAAGVAVARHLGLVLMLQGSVAAVLGQAVTRGLLFPLSYLLFLVPAGEGLVPPLQQLTARMCMGLLALGGMPARLDGVFITTPSGWFEVAEACSGVKFLIAMVAYGALVANVCFRSWRRRILFMAVAVAMPVAANGIRAWATIYVASLTSINMAGQFDHVVYGWIFFAVVIAATMAVGWRHFDRHPTDAWVDPARLDPAPRRHRLALDMAAAVLAIAAAPIAWEQGTAAASPTIAGRLDLPAVRGWTRVPMQDRLPWTPGFATADHSLRGRYRDGRGRAVDLAIVLYARQAEGRELVGFGQGAVEPGGAWVWSRNLPGPATGRTERIVAPGGLARVVTSFYRVGDVTTGSDMRVKLETLKVRLLGGDQRAVAVLVSATEPGASPAIDAFLRDLDPVDHLVAATLARAAR